MSRTLKRRISRRIRGERRCRRAGLATLDAVLLIAIVLPLAAAILGLAPRGIRLVYESLLYIVLNPLL